MPKAPLRLGTRGSTLARLQSNLVADALRALGVDVELVPIVTAGDVRPPDTAWGEGAFVGALESALRSGAIDFAVHSAKDVPIEPEVDLVIAAYPLRADPRDALVLRRDGSGAGDGAKPGHEAANGVRGAAATTGSAGAAAIGASDGAVATRASEGAAALAALPIGAIVGTDSPRRTGFLRSARPDLKVVPLHGNVDTRLRRLDEGTVDALVLAVAGLDRIGRADRISAILPAETVPPAPGQGALAVQIRRSDGDLAAVIGRLDDSATRIAVTAEREVLETTGGGCRAPIGVLATLDGGLISIIGAAVEPTGENARFEHATGPESEAMGLARELGRRLVEGRAPTAEAPDADAVAAR